MKRLTPTGLCNIPYVCATLLLTFGFSLSLAGQNDALRKASEAYEEDRFREALVYLNRIDKINSSGPLLFKRGVCLYETNQLEQAMADFRQAWAYGYEEPEIDQYTGLIFHNRGEFATAASYYKKYLRELSADSPDRPRVRQLIRQCGRAIDLSYRTPIAIIERLPGEINSVYDEVGMIQSPTIDNRYYFSSNMPNTGLSMEASDFDVYVSNESDLSWSEATRLPYAINKSKEEIVLGFTTSADGMILFRGPEYDGTMTISRRKGENNLTQEIEFPVQFSVINADAFFYDDHLVLFSAKLDQGYGGYDLYYIKKEEGTWTEPINLGSSINGPEDEISPYLNADGSELYFSSNRDESIGGFDVFYSPYLFESVAWRTPENLGIPINSPGDDTYFSLTYDGLSALLTSDRKTSTGGKDIFLARFKRPRGLQLYNTDYIPFADYKVNRDEVVIDTMLEVAMIHESDTSVYVPETSAPNLDTTQENYTFEPLYYNRSQDLFEKENLGEIDRLANYLLDHPQVTATIEVHSANEGIQEFKLFSSIKLAERIKIHLISQGVADHQVSVRSMADHYPVTLSENKGGQIGLSDLFNARVELDLYTADGRSIIDRIAPDIPKHSYDERYDLLSTLLEDAITYKVQIAVMSQMYRGMALDLFNDAMVESDEETDLYLYTIGWYDSYSLALETKRKMERLGITDPRIIPYYNGHRVTADRLVYYVNDYPDLRNLMNYGN